MQSKNEERLYSASDLVNFLECEHLTTLDLQNLVTPLPQAPDDEQAKLIQAKGIGHELAFLERLRAQHAEVVDIAAVAKTLDEKVAATLDAMRVGVDIIYQATLRDGPLVGHADFLRRVPRTSDLGAFSYEVLDTKLARTARAKFLIQLAFYSELLTRAQGTAPVMMHVVLGDHREVGFRHADYAKYFNTLLERFHTRVQAMRADTYPDPCDFCSLCRWRALCAERRLQDDHLSQTANISRVQIRKLETAGVSTLGALATLDPEVRIPKMATETLARLRHQASLQVTFRTTGELQLALLPSDPTTVRGFSRLPLPDRGDLFFDMEGDPLEERGLEYLFGVYFLEKNVPQFKAFWAHSRAEEKRAFEAFMDFVTARLRTHPGAHIYHYAPYEATALKRLMSLHGTREAEVDQLLRAGTLIDLYRVVVEALRVSEPRYSIKNIEHFYLEKRAGEVTNAGASIVFYERWKETGDAQLLRDIEDYNFDDVRSTFELLQWLLRLRPAGLSWAGHASTTDTSSETTVVGALNEAETRLVRYRETLLESLPQDTATWGANETLNELTYQLLDFQRRAAKPDWWALFARADMSEEELMDDAEALAGLTQDPDYPPFKDKRSVVYTYHYPEQESKLKTGDPCVRADTTEPLTGVTINGETRRVTVRRGEKKDPLPERLSLGKGGPLSAPELTNAAFRFADSVIAGDHRYAAIEALLRGDLPRITGHTSGTPLISEDAESLPQIISAISRLERSYVFVQGPPGSGKTYTGSHVIVDLLKQGFRVGISSNSHKAINNLLAAVEREATSLGVRFGGAKKSNQAKPDGHFDGVFVQDVFNNEDIFIGGFQLVAGTAWLFSDPRMDQTLDFLFVDEAGQVALANLIAMATSSRNIVLLGDQMQLGQPTKGVHPGRSGESTLDYLLGGTATIPPERGIFLKTTWRMHPDVCRFISDAVYDSRLEPEAKNINQVLVLNSDAHPALQPTGIRYIPIDHEGCAQRSHEEAQLVSDLVANLLTQRFRDKHGREHPLTLDNILVVAPYNMQVNLLKQVLPEGARVGTVDKFQGQEAEVIIVSMATSSGDDLPRNIDFLYSKNRLNVAISRARSLVLFIANPKLMAIRCSTPEEMKLVNLLCWLHQFTI